MICPNCSAENRVGQRFCVKCGTPLTRVCPSCGTPAEPADAFCGTCGTPIAGAAPAAAPRAEPSTAASSSERRLVSVLFADLVDFTALSERRDSEEVRELLS